MSALPRTTFLACIAALPLLAACSTLGGNVGGDFTCRAPEGTCAPTTAIDAAAIDAAASGPLTNGSAAGGIVRGSDQHFAAEASARALRIVIAARRDEAGRVHEARVVQVTLPEPAGDGWRQPASTGDLLRAIGQAVAPQAASTPTDQSSSLPELPGQLFLPSPTGPASPGADAPVGGAPGYSPLPDRVPQYLSDGSENAAQGYHP